MKKDELTTKRNAFLNIVQDVRDFCNIPQVKKAFIMGNEIFAAVQPLFDKPSWWNVGRASVGVGKVVVNSLETDSDSFFGGDDWSTPFSNDFAHTILKVLWKMPARTMKTNEDGVQIKIVDIGEGVLAGWTHNTRYNSAYHVYVQTDKLQQARIIIKDLLWKQFNGASLVLRLNKKGFSSNADSDGTVIFDVDDSFETLPSEKATEYTTYLTRCMNAGISRSVMLYGPPGTGKSTLARTLVKDLKLRSFRVRIEDITSFDSGTLFESIQIFEPDAVILDDFDRARGQASLLEVLEFFQHKVKLVIATVNDRNELDEALMRPGRFDELVEVDRMDDAVVKMVLGPYIDGFEFVKNWPIAFVHEYVKRRRFMDVDDANAAMIELAQRVQRLMRYRDTDEVSRMISALEPGQQLTIKHPADVKDHVPTLAAVKKNRVRSSDFTEELAMRLKNIKKIKGKKGKSKSLKKVLKDAGMKDRG